MADVTISNLPLGIPSKSAVIPFSQEGTTYNNSISAINSPYHVSFFLYNVSSDQIVISNQFVKVTFESIIFNNNITSSNSEVIIPVNGVYSFNSNIVQNTFSSNWSYTYTNILVNGGASGEGRGARVHKGSKSFTSSDRECLISSNILKLNKNDVISLGVQVVVSGSETTNIDNLRIFSGALIHPTN